MNPELFEDSDEEDGADDMIVKQAEGARVGGRMLCALSRCVQGRERGVALEGGGHDIRLHSQSNQPISHETRNNPINPSNYSIFQFFPGHFQ